MQLTPILTSFSSTRPARLTPEAPSDKNVVTFMMATTHRPLYAAPVTMKPRTVKALVAHALEKLAPFGIPDLKTWAIEVSQGDEDYQVDFVNSKGACLSVDGLVLTSNKCGVTLDFGISASTR